MLSEDELDDLIADTHFQQGRDYERERIIALLDNANSIYDWHSNCRLCEAIALVKGENE